MTLIRKSSFLLANVLVGLVLGQVAPAQVSDIPIVGSGELKSLSLWPDKVTLWGAEQVQQLVLTGHYANGGIRDLTAQASFRVADPQIVRMEKGGLLVSAGNGITEVTAEVEGKSVKLKVAVTEAERELPINSANEIVPIFSKLGCNAGACHGRASGQNGFRLSLLGFEPQLDYEALTREARGRRVFPAAPEASLLLLKPTGVVPHGGGKRLQPGSRNYQLIMRWIRSGMPFGRDSDPKVVGITLVPAHRLIAPRSRQQIAVIARFNDGSQRDVTPEAKYSSNDEELVRVSETGRVEPADRPGEGAVMVRYLGHVAVFRATIPQAVPTDKLVLPAPNNFIDEHVFAKLKQLGLPPSELCSDSEFLRRASLDITGTLPTAAEGDKFLKDTDPKKRAKLVDDLLNRPAYASYFALKWGDILRDRQKGLVGVGGGAYLGPAYDPFAANPNEGPKALLLPSELTADRLQNRQKILAALDRLRRDVDASGMMEGMDTFTRQAFEMVTGKAARQALDVSQESVKTREKYGNAAGRRGLSWGQSCLLARRLVEAGVGFVAVGLEGWDDHSKIKEQMQGRAAAFAKAVAALIEDLYERGLDKKVAVLIWGEFGRTPRVNTNAGRDHWPSSMSVLLAGGGMKMGQVIGSTNDKGEKPKDRPLYPNDVLATIYRHLVIDHTQAFINPAGRPIPILPHGEPIAELL